jgi:hypothetical protein
MIFYCSLHGSVDVSLQQLLEDYRFLKGRFFSASKEERGAVIEDSVFEVAELPIRGACFCQCPNSRIKLTTSQCKKRTPASRARPYVITLPTKWCGSKRLFGGKGGKLPDI